MKEKLNVRTIAKLIDVSPITVSRALNGHPSVKSSTRNKILKKVSELGYNYKSRSTTVRNERLKNVAIHCIDEKLHGDIYFNFYGQLYFFCINRLKALGYTGHTIDLGRGSDENEDVLSKCGSLILFNLVPPEVMEKVRKKHPHMNIISIFAEEPNGYTVCPDDVRGGQMAAEYLLERNHRHVAVLTELDEPCYRLRYSGFQGHMIYKCPDAQVDLIRFTNPLCKDEADKIKLEVLESYFDGLTELPTAIFATNGYSAIFLCNFLKKKGLSVPEDIGLIGYDNYDYYRVSDVPLTRVYFDLKLLARQAIQLLDNIARKNVSGKFNIQTPVEFIDKQSVKTI